MNTTINLDLPPPVKYWIRFGRKTKFETKFGTQVQPHFIGRFLIALLLDIHFDKATK